MYILPAELRMFALKIVQAELSNSGLLASDY